MINLITVVYDTELSLLRTQASNFDLYVSSEDISQILILVNDVDAVADQIKTNQKNFDKINDKSIDITPMVELMKDNPNGLDDPTKEHIRSMDISIKRLVEDSNQASKQLASELRSEIKLLAKTISAAVEKNKK